MAKNTSLSPEETRCLLGWAIDLEAMARSLRDACPQLAGELHNLSCEMIEFANNGRMPNPHRLVYNKATKKIDKIRNYDGLCVESFDPPTE